MPIPDIYFDVLACPKCRNEVSQRDDRTLECIECDTTYPVVDGIPILFSEVSDAVSQAIQKFYDAGWERDESDELVAKAIHEDLSTIGQRYIQQNERRFVGVFTTGGRFFLDAAAGAQPRTEFGGAFDYHVCVDFSITGLRECRRQLGDRAIVIGGSLLNLPIRDGVCDGVLASHCLYHIEKDNQNRAVTELGRVQSPPGKTLIFYANPQAVERRLARRAKRLLRKGSGIEDLPSQTDDFYYYAHPIASMRAMLRSAYGSAHISVAPLRLFSTRVTGRAFRNRMLAPAAYGAIRVLEMALAGKADWSRYVCYVVEREKVTYPGV